MNKGEGKKIAIKFTENLVGDVSGKNTPTPYSFYRWYITSTWSSSGRLYLYELEFFSNGTKVNTNKIISMAGSSRYSSSYDVNRLFDGSVPGTEWDANGSLPHWVSIELDEAIVIDSFRWHTGTSGNKPKEFILQGSNDGINWANIYEDESPNLNNWIDFVVAGVGNEIAFTVTGKEYQYVNGPLIDKEYQVEKVERYPIAKLWWDDFSGQMDGVEVGVSGVVLGKEEGDDPPPFIKYRIFILNNHGSTEFVQARDIRLYENSTNVSVGQTYEALSTSFGTPADAFDENNDTVWADSTNLQNNWLSVEFASPKRIGKLTMRGRNSDQIIKDFKLQGWDGTQWVDLITGTLAMQDTTQEWIVPNEMVYSTLGTYTTTIPAATLPTNPRLRFEAHAPEDTMVTVEYACTDDDETPPKTWMSVDDEDLLTIDNAYLWLRYTLETEDTSKTPTLLAVWLEEPDAPQDTILLTMDPLKRFNNVEGELTVSYDQNKGVLNGEGGSVRSFERSFLPTGLAPVPNPYSPERIVVKHHMESSFIRIYYTSAYANEKITAKPNLAVDFINVSEINP